MWSDLICHHHVNKRKMLLGLIFNKFQNKFQDPSKLRRFVVDLIEKENWSVMSADVKGDAYEGLLEENVQDTKSGAGQYFTPRPLIQAMVDVIQPKPKETLSDPACGICGDLFRKLVSFRSLSIRHLLAVTIQAV
jgi:type I restriction enzyme M protein